MNKERFKRSQPVVYRTLSNALRRDTLAHAYLFAGPKGTLKSEVALLLAQSIMCSHRDKDGFACQTCAVCKRIEREESIDFFWHHRVGYDLFKPEPFDAEKKIKSRFQYRIKKKDIIALQDFFESTSAETSDRRVYILEDYDQATPDASNSLLKFLEEPRPGIYGILLTDEKSNVLPTIQSRCQLISFRPASFEEEMNELQNVTDSDSAAMLVQNGYTKEQSLEFVSSPAWPIIKEAAFACMKSRWDLYQILTMQRDIFPSKGTYTTREWVRLWIEWILYAVKNNKVSLELDTRVSLQLLLVEQLDIMKNPVDLALFLDRLYNQIRKVVRK